MSILLDILLSENSQYKLITFPKEEIPQLKKQDTIFTTRVSSDYDKYFVGDIVITPWKVKFRISKRINITNIKNHPYYNELTNEQIKLLSRYNKIACIWIVKV